MAHAAASTLTLIRINREDDALRPRASKQAPAYKDDLDELQDREETLMLRRLVARKQNRDRTSYWN